jgi:pre-mRNA-processing factor 39
VYDHFFVEYPLCYGYWKKFADCEARHSNAEAAIAIYERGVSATPYSADLWAHYAAYKKTVEGANADEVRA